MLNEHAKQELQLAGLLDKDSDYNGMLGTATLELMAVFAKQGHSGASASMTIDLFTRLARLEALTPLTSNPDEWFCYDETEAGGTQKTWQSKRNPAVFSRDGGATWYHLDDPNFGTAKRK